MEDKTDEKMIENVHKMLRDMTRMYQKSQGRITLEADEEDEEKVKLKYVHATPIN